MPAISQIKFRRGTATAWTTANPVLGAGEPGFETDTGNFKIGNGTDDWNTLPYSGGGGVYQPLDAELTAIAGLVSAADTLPYFTGSGTAALTPLTSFARTLIDDATAADARTTLGAGVANGLATLDSAGKVPINQLPLSVMTYEGVWNANTNTPTLSDATGERGQVYKVSVAGSQDLGSGTISFNVGDYAIHNGTAWEKADTTDAVVSVNGTTGVVTVNAINQLTGDVTTTAASGSESKTATIASGVITNAHVNASAAIAESKLALDYSTASLNSAIAGRQPLDSTLTALAAYNTNGLITQTAPDTFTGRTIQAADAKISITNGDGVAGNPTIGLAFTTGSGDTVVLNNGPQINGSITTSSTSFNLLNTTATSINFGSAATTMNIGATTGTTTVKNALTVDGLLTANNTALVIDGGSP